MENQVFNSSRLEVWTKKWWFFLIFILFQAVPPYASKSYKWSESSDVIMQTLRHAFIYSYTWLYPVFKIIPIALIVLMIFLRNKTTRLFNAYVAISYVVFAFGQNISVTKEYGLSIVIVNLIMFPIVAAFWFWEVAVQQNDFSRFFKQPIRKYWVIPLAVLAFWYPINMRSVTPNFNPIYIFTNCAGVTFCMMTPVYLALLIVCHPSVNIVTMRVTSIVGVIIGLYNMGTNFLIIPSILWFNGVLHIPLLLISAYALIVSLKTAKCGEYYAHKI